MAWKFFRILLFRFDPEFAHSIGGIFLRLYGFLTAGRPPRYRGRRRRRFELAGMELDSPLGVAAGFDKNAKYIQGLSAFGFGFVEVGTITPRPQKGNPRPRLFRLPESRALINRFGFNSEGSELVAQRLEHLRAMCRVQIPIGVNIGKNRDTPLAEAARDYESAMERLYPYADYLVINISSPNTPGLTGLQEGDALGSLLAATRNCRDKLLRLCPGQTRPLFLKLSPDLHEDALKMAAQSAMAAGFQGIIASNTTRRRDFPGLEANGRVVKEEGGLSGAPLRGEALERLVKLRGWLGGEALIISVGGLGGPDDAEARLAAGANLLQVYTEFVYAGPSYPKVMAKALR